jgi:hypothetical protein
LSNTHFDMLVQVRRVRLPLRQGQPAGLVFADGQQWQILEVRDQWLHPTPHSAPTGHEVQRWVLLVEGPPLFDAGESTVREVIVSAFAEDSAWWMDVS